MSEWTESVWMAVDACEELTSPALEVLAQALDLARTLNGGVRVLVFSRSELPTTHIQAWLRYGAGAVTVLLGSDLAGPDPLARLAAVEAALKRGSPQVLLAAEAEHALVWAARLAVRRGAPIVTHCIQANLWQQRLRVRRAACRNTVHLTQEFTMEADRSPAVLVMAGGSWAAPPKAEAAAKPAQIIAVPAATSPTWLTRLERTVPPPGALDLSDADLVLSGGAGLHGPEGFAALREAARRLGAAVGASRLAVDRGWAKPEEQVGITGLSIAPKVYVTFGISGAREHLSGVTDAKQILAVNTDRYAPIADVARLLVLADAAAVLSALAKETQRQAESANE